MPRPTPVVVTYLGQHQFAALLAIQGVKALHQHCVHGWPPTRRHATRLHPSAKATSAPRSIILKFPCATVSN